MLELLLERDRQDDDTDELLRLLELTQLLELDIDWLELDRLLDLLDRQLLDEDESESSVVKPDGGV